MWLLWTVGVIVHAMVLVSVRNLYAVPGIPEAGVAQEVCKLPEGAPARRLVLLLVDGLGSDVFYSTVAQSGNESFFRRVMTEEGVWGVAKAVEPSSDRSGTLALTAGILDRPPLFGIHPPSQAEFDHIFNRSKHTFYFGDPRVPSYYSRSRSTADWSKFCYPEEWVKQKWDTDVTQLDRWVLDRVGQFLEDSAEDYTLRWEGVVFFVHLRGPDLAGHIESSSSNRAVSAVKEIDRGVERLVDQFEERFGDGRTAFVVVSDHGFVDTWYQGRHGGGTPEELNTPILAWGSGLEGPRPPGLYDTPSPNDWNTSDVKRRDISQVDVAPLLSSLLGLPVPVHSYGVLPRYFLDASDGQWASLLACNAFQLAELNLANSVGVGTGSMFFPRNFWNPLDSEEIRQEKENITMSIDEGKFDAANAASRRLMSASLDSIRFYQTYHQSIASFQLILTMVGWGLILLLALIPLNSQNEVSAPVDAPTQVEEDTKWNFLNVSLSRLQDSFKRTSFLIIFLDSVFVAALVWSVYAVHLRELPAAFYAYFTVPTVIWWFVVRNLPAACRAARDCKCDMRFVLVFVTTSLAELFILTMYNKLGAVAGFVIFVLYSVMTDMKSVPTGLTARWVLSTLPVIVLPFYRSLGFPFSYCLFFAGGFSWLASGCYFLHKSKAKGWDLGLVMVLFFLLGTSMTNGYMVQTGTEDEYGVLYIVSWDILITINIVPLLLGSSKLLMRLFQVCLCVSVPFVLFTVRHESLALFAIAVHMSYWLLMEVHDRYDFTEGLKAKTSFLARDQKRLELGDLRRSSLYFIYLVVSYYAVGLTSSGALLDRRWTLAFSKIQAGTNEILPFVLLKASLVFLLVTSFFVCHLRLSNSSVHGFLIMSMSYANLSGLQSLLALVVTRAESLTLFKASLYRYFMGQILPLLILVLFPISVLLTGPSFVQVLQHRRRPGESLINLNSS